MTQPVDPYRAEVAAVRASLVAYAAAAWAASGVDDQSMTVLTARMTAAVISAQLRVANLTSVFLARRTGTTPVPVSRDLVTTRRGIPPERVYQRPVIAARTALAQQKTFQEAKDIGGRRLEQLATTDVQLAKIQQVNESLTAAGSGLYRRVPKGESTCALCLIASTQVYTVGNLAPLHPGCDCDFHELAEGQSLDDLIDSDALLEATHARVKELTGVDDRGGRAPDYRKLLITHHHGEMGPVLGWASDDFTGPQGL